MKQKLPQTFCSAVQQNIVTTAEKWSLQLPVVSVNGGKNSRLPNSVRHSSHSVTDLSAKNDSKLSLHAISVSCSIFIFTVSWLHMHFSGNIQTCCKLQNWAQKIVTYHQCQITVFSGELSITSFCETGILNSKNAPFNIQDNW